MAYLYGLTKKYYGHYENNLKEGIGEFIWEDGNSFEGYWKSGKQNGYGIIKSGGDSKFCLWSNGKLIKIIEDEVMKEDIEKTFEKSKQSPDYIEFQYNIKRYEKIVNNCSSSEETGTENNDKDKDKDKG